MSTDRELLELAAKAAGIDLQWMGEGRMAACFDPAGENEWWNPLTDDGDALRLAVKLELSLRTSKYGRQRATIVEWGMRRGNALGSPHLSDPCAGARRAIVLAAAEIGKATP